MIKANISDLEASEIAEGLLSGYTLEEEDDGTLETASEELAYYLVTAVQEFNEEWSRRSKKKAEENAET